MTHRDSLRAQALPPKPRHEGWCVWGWGLWEGLLCPRGREEGVCDDCYSHSAHNILLSPSSSSSSPCACAYVRSTAPS